MVENLSGGDGNSSQYCFFGTDRTSAEPVEDTETTGFVAEFVSILFSFLFLCFCSCVCLCLIVLPCFYTVCFVQISNCSTCSS